MAKSGSVPGKVIIRTSVEKVSRGVPEMGRLCGSTKKVEPSGSVPGKSRIRASVEKLSRRVPENGQISVSTEKWKNRGQYPEKVEFVRMSKKGPGVYQKRVDSVGVPKNGIIRVSPGKK